MAVRALLGLGVSLLAGCVFQVNGLALDGSANAPDLAGPSNADDLAGPTFDLAALICFCVAMVTPMPF